MKARILVIDDDAAIRDSLRMILEYERYDFTGAASGQDGLSLVARDRPDLVMLDIKMPGMDGMEVLRKLHAQDETLPVVMISGHGTTSTAVEAIRSGAIDFLDKPLSSERVIVTIQNALKQRDLSQENRELKVAMESRYEIVGESSPVRNVLESVKRAAPTARPIAGRSSHPPEGPVPMIAQRTRLAFCADEGVCSAARGVTRARSLNEHGGHPLPARQVRHSPWSRRP